MSQKTTGVHIAAKARLPLSDPYAAMPEPRAHARKQAPKAIEMIIRIRQ